MSEKIEFEVTAGMLIDARHFLQDIPDVCMIVAIEDALAHPSFQSQLRAYVAEEMRKVVPAEEMPVTHGGAEESYARAFNECRATTLTNIAAYEKEQEDGE